MAAIIYDRVTNMENDKNIFLGGWGSEHALMYNQIGWVEITRER